ncbi:hypothetical protein Angca_000730, partial [Angiostrongylus cantonensis]
MSRPGAWAVVLSNLWKYLRKDWSTKASYVYIGEDALGNRYYEIKNTRQNVTRSVFHCFSSVVPSCCAILRLYFEEGVSLKFVGFKLSGYDPPTGASNPQTPTVEWQSWLKGTRRFPPSEEEIALNRMRQQAQLAQNLTTEQRAPHVAATGTSQKQDKPAAFPHFEDLESAPGAKKS